MVVNDVLVNTQSVSSKVSLFQMTSVSLYIHFEPRTASDTKVLVIFSDKAREGSG